MKNKMSKVTKTTLQDLGYNFDEEGLPEMMIVFQKGKVFWVKPGEPAHWHVMTPEMAEDLAHLHLKFAARERARVADRKRRE